MSHAMDYDRIWDTFHDEYCDCCNEGDSEHIPYKFQMDYCCKGCKYIKEFREIQHRVRPNDKLLYEDRLDKEELKDDKD